MAPGLQLGNGASGIAFPGLPQFELVIIMLTMEEALKQSGTMPFAAGNIVKGTIIEVRPKEVLVDIGYKSEGVISGNEFEDIKTVKVGDEIDVLIEKLEDKEGMVVLSKEKAEFKKNWERILTICNEGGTHRRQGQSHRQRRLLEAIKTVEPELDAFYGLLTDEQKARFNQLGAGEG